MSYHIGAWTAFGSLDSSLMNSATQALNELRSDISALRNSAKFIQFQQGAGDLFLGPLLSPIFDFLTQGRPEGADAALNTVDAATNFVNVVAPDLLNKANAGDEHALVNLARAAKDIRSAVEDASKILETTISAGAFVRRFIDEVVKKTGKEVLATSNVLLWVAGGVLLTALFFRVKG